MPKYTLSKQTSSMSVVSKTKNGDSDKATKQFLVGRMRTCERTGHP